MLILQAIILGAIQGLTEFIPVSSSGHLVIIPKLFGWKDMGLSFDVALHLGTLVAVIVYFGRDWIGIIRGFCAHVFRGQAYDKSQNRLLVPIIIACVPAAIVGKLWEDTIEQTLRSHVFWILGSMVIMAGVMLMAERTGKKLRDMQSMTYRDFIFIGLAQALALFPGVSRSGVTISAGLFRGIDRATAAKFSFLLSTPIILGAGLLRLKDAFETGLPAGETTVFVAGFLSAMAFGYLAIKFLMTYLQTRTLNAFAFYRFGFAAVAVVLLLVK